MGVMTHQLWLVWRGAGVIDGIGLGLGYISPVSTLIKWFPDWRGMATGMAIMGFGGGAMVGSPLAQKLMEHFSADGSIGVWQTFLTMAAIYLVFMMGGAFGYRIPPAGWKLRAPFCTFAGGVSLAQFRCARGAVSLFRQSFVYLSNLLVYLRSCYPRGDSEQPESGMALEYEEIVRSGLPRQVADLIRTAILEGRLKVDERLPTEEELAQRFGISRPTVREALKVLAAQNLIRARRGPTGGTFVCRPDPEQIGRTLTDAATLLIGVGTFSVDEIVSARIETESVCCRLAAEHRRDEDLEQLAAEITRQRDQSLSDEEFCASDVRFHRALATATCNGPLRLMMYAVIESFVPVTNLLIYADHERRLTVDGHAHVLDAVSARDGDRAAKAMREHLNGMHAILDRALARRASRNAAAASSEGNNK